MLNKFSDVDKLSKSDFEIFIGEIFSECGWKNVEITKPGHEYKYGDGGVDIYCEKSNKKFAIECKHRKIENKCDVGDLNQLHTGADLAKVKNKILVTNTYFTSETEFRAFKLGIELIDRNKLKDLYESRSSEIGKKIKPYPYQQDITNKCLEYYKNKKNKMLIELATGLGKTYTVAFIIKELLKNSDLKILFLAHQVEIVAQSATAFKNIFGVGNYSYSGCVGGFIPEEKTTFTFGVFDTIYSRMNKFEKEQFDIIVVDEAHHSPANTYSAVVEYFKPKLLIGLTATPFRTDRKDVLEFFGGPEGHIGKYDLYWALKHKWLAFPRYEVHMHDVSQQKIDAIEKGFAVEDIDKNLFIKEKDDKMIESLEKKAATIKNCKAIVFCRSIPHIKHLLGYFPKGSATFVHSKCLADERRNNIRDFREGNFRYILTCNLFNEGIDIPETNLLVFLRATNSRLIWLQQLGRGLRKTKVKEFVDVWDFVGSVSRIMEIKSLEKAYDEQQIDKSNLRKEESDESEKLNIPSKHYDDKIKVKWASKGAAKVLKLLKKQEYDLVQYNDAISSLRSYYEKYEKIPKIEDLEKSLANISNDQINTLFHSYYGFCELSLPYESKKTNEYFKNTFMKYLKNFYKENNIVPSYKTLEQNLVFENLPLINKNFIRSVFKATSYPIKEFDEKIRKEIQKNLKNE
tara:strand:+ start:834 stop:2891 length:2058 start_codon:yes stop_codon:yes gene_type:complete